MSGSYIHNTVLNLVVHMHLILGLCFIVCLLIFPLARLFGGTSNVLQQATQIDQAHRHHAAGLFLVFPHADLKRDFKRWNQLKPSSESTFSNYFITV